MKKNSISTENYESYLIDYLDNNLPEEMVEELMSFLDQHPEIMEEANDLSAFKLVPEDVSFDNDNLKNSLKKSDITPPMPFSPDELFVAENEGDISREEREALRVILDFGNNFEKDRKIYSQIKLKPDISKVFEPKESLYHLAIEADEPVNKENFDEYAVAYHEGDLTDVQREKLEGFIKNNPEYRDTLDLYSKLYLPTAQNIVFDEKDKLKKRGAVILPSAHFLRIAVSVAAVFVLLLLYPGMLNDNKSNIYPKTDRKPLVSSHIAKVRTPVKDDKSENGIVALKKRRPKVEIYEKAEPVNNKPLLNIESQNIAKEVAMQPVSTFNYASCIFKVDSGYYEVKLERRSFLKDNPTLKKRLIAGVRKFLKISPKEIKTPEDRFTLWDIADVSIKGINALTENEFSLSRK